MRDLFEMQSTLHAYRDFSECVVKEIAFSDNGTTVIIIIDYIWNNDGTVRDDTDTRTEARLEFRTVQEFEMHNELRPQVVEDPSLINWSQNEVALVEVRMDHRSQRYEQFAVPFYHGTLWWENAPWIDVVFAELTISEHPA